MADTETRATLQPSQNKKLHVDLSSIGPQSPIQCPYDDCPFIAVGRRRRDSTNNNLVILEQHVYNAHHLALALPFRSELYNVAHPAPLNPPVEHGLYKCTHPGCDEVVGPSDRNDHGFKHTRYKAYTCSELKKGYQEQFDHFADLKIHCHDDHTYGKDGQPLYGKSGAPKPSLGLIAAQKAAKALFAPVDLTTLSAEQISTVPSSDMLKIPQVQAIAGRIDPTTGFLRSPPNQKLIAPVGEDRFDCDRCVDLYIQPG